MIKLDDDLLAELGLAALPPDDKKRMLTHIYETLEMRVGMELAKQMSDAQLNEFEQFINRNDEAGALKWLETNFPNYKEVVAAEFEKLKVEIKQVAPQILHDAQQAAAQAPQQPQMPPAHADPNAGYAPQPQHQMPPQQYAPPAGGYAAAPVPQPGVPAQPQPQYAPQPAYGPAPVPMGAPMSGPGPVPTGQPQPAPQQPYAPAQPQPGQQSGYVTDDDQQQAAAQPYQPQQ
jgi:hypothetical protein